jgi:hypothetical protein
MSTATLPEANGVHQAADDWTTEIPEPGSGGTFVPCPAGNHAAVCFGLVALGTHEDTYQGETKSQRKLALLFETPGEIDPEGNAYTFALEFTWSLHEKAKLRLFLEGWRGRKFADEQIREFSIANVVGKPCLLNVTQSKGKKDRVYANAGAATPLPKGMPVPTPFREVGRLLAEAARRRRRAAGDGVAPAALRPADRRRREGLGRVEGPPRRGRRRQPPGGGHGRRAGRGGRRHPVLGRETTPAGRPAKGARPACRSSFSPSL